MRIAAKANTRDGVAMAGKGVEQRVRSDVPQPNDAIGAAAQQQRAVCATALSAPHTASRRSAVGATHQC